MLNTELSAKGYQAMSYKVNEYGGCTMLMFKGDDTLDFLKNNYKIIGRPFKSAMTGAYIVHAII